MEEVSGDMPEGGFHEEDEEVFDVPEGAVPEEEPESSINEQFEEYENVYNREFLVNKDDVATQNRLINHVNALQTYLEKKDNHKDSTVHINTIEAIHSQQQNIRGLQISIERTKKKHASIQTFRGKVTNKEKNTLKDMEIELENRLTQEYNLVTQYKNLIEFENDTDLPKADERHSLDESLSGSVSNQGAAILMGVEKKRAVNDELVGNVMQFYLEDPDRYVERIQNLTREQESTREGDLGTYFKSHKHIKVDRAGDNDLDQLLEELDDIKGQGMNPDPLKNKYIEIRNRIRSEHLSRMEVSALKEILEKMKHNPAYDDEDYAFILQQKPRGAEHAKYDDWKDAHPFPANLKFSIEDNMWVQNVLQKTVLSPELNEGAIDEFLNYFIGLLQKKAEDLGLPYMYLPDSLSFVKKAVRKLPGRDQDTIMAQYRSVANQVNKSNFETWLVQEEGGPDDEKAGEVEQEGKTKRYDLWQELIASGHPTIMEKVTKTKGKHHGKGNLEKIWLEHWKQNASEEEKKNGYPDGFRNKTEFTNARKNELRDLYLHALSSLELVDTKDRTPGTKNEYKPESKKTIRIYDHAPEHQQNYNPWHSEAGLDEGIRTRIVQPLEGHHAELLTHEIVGTTYHNYIAWGVGEAADPRKRGESDTSRHRDAATELAILTGEIVPFNQRYDNPATTAEEWKKLRDLVHDVIRDADPEKVKQSAEMMSTFDKRIMRGTIFPTKQHILDTIVNQVAEGLAQSDAYMENKKLSVTKGDAEDILKVFAPIEFDLKKKNVWQKFREALGPLVKGGNTSKFHKFIWTRATQQEKFPPIDELHKLPIYGGVDIANSLQYLVDDHGMKPVDIAPDDMGLVDNEGRWDILQFNEGGQGYAWTHDTVLGKYVDQVINNILEFGQPMDMNEIFGRYTEMVPEHNTKAMKAVLETLVNYYIWTNPSSWLGEDYRGAPVMEKSGEETVYHSGVFLLADQLLGRVIQGQAKPHFTQDEVKKWFEDRPIYSEQTEQGKENLIERVLQQRMSLLPQTLKPSSCNILPDDNRDTPPSVVGSLHEPRKQTVLSHRFQFGRRQPRFVGVLAGSYGFLKLDSSGSTCRMFHDPFNNNPKRSKLDSLPNRDV